MRDNIDPFRSDQDLPTAIMLALRRSCSLLRWEPLNGGLSGATLWRGVDQEGRTQTVLKRWPTGMTAPRLLRIHRWMRQARLLSFVPRLLEWEGGSTVWVHHGLCWDLTSWQPGHPRTRPTAAELRLACEAVARLHAAWPQQGQGTCPGVLHRWQWLSNALCLLDKIDELQRRYAPWEEVLIEVRCTVRLHLPRLLERLRPALNLEGPLQVCLRDLRHEHVLFSFGTEGPFVSGIVDYGAADIDHPVVDLARLLGDYATEASDRLGLFEEGLTAYEAVGRSLGPWRQLAFLLHETGTLAAIVRWLHRLHHGLDPPLDPQVAFRRLGELLRHCR